MTDPGERRQPHWRPFGVFGSGTTASAASLDDRDPGLLPRCGAVLSGWHLRTQRWWGGWGPPRPVVCTRARHDGTSPLHVPDPEWHQETVPPLRQAARAVAGGRTVFCEVRWQLLRPGLAFAVRQSGRGNDKLERDDEPPA